MIDLKHLLILAKEYKRATGKEDTTISSRVFGDGKKLSALKSGADITTTRFNAAIIWFSENWPEKARWPKDLERPMRETAQ